MFLKENTHLNYSIRFDYNKDNITNVIQRCALKVRKNRQNTKSLLLQKQ